MGIVIISKWLIPKGYRGLTLFPFIILKYKKSRSDKVLLNHEKIHWRQQLELLIIPFYLWYALEFIVRLILVRNWKMAYVSLSFEKEAYTNEKDLNYLKSRSFWKFLKYY